MTQLAKYLRMSCDVTINYDICMPSINQTQICTQTVKYLQRLQCSAWFCKVTHVGKNMLCTYTTNVYMHMYIE